jgi:hypothetical protein
MNSHILYVCTTVPIFVSEFDILSQKISTQNFANEFALTEAYLILIVFTVLVLKGLHHDVLVNANLF